MVSRLREAGLCLVTAFGIVGCVSPVEEESYVGWQCSGDRRGDNWTCEQREVIDGKPVTSPVESKTVESKHVSKKLAAVGSTSVNQDEVNDGAAVKPEKEKPKLIYVGVPNQHWRSQLPTLTAEPVIEAGGEPTLLRRSKRLSDREPEAVTLTARAQAKNTSSDEPIPTPVPEHSIRVSGVDDDMDEGLNEDLNEGTEAESEHQVPSQTAVVKGFTLQLGAFKTLGQLQTFVRDHQLEGLSFRQIETQSEGNRWHVITWGQFNSPAEAEQAWAVEAENYPKVQPWVRPLRSLKGRELALES